MVILNFILIVLIIVYGSRILVRFVLPWLIKRKFEKMQGQYNQRTEDTRTEGEVHINNKDSHTSKKNHKDVGEYVEYEEVD